MDRGLYAAASAGLLQVKKLEVVSNNIANSNTPGFKRQIIKGEERTFDQTLAKLVAGEDPYAEGDHQRISGVGNVIAATDFTAGPIRNTGNALDVALSHANDFFVVNGADGRENFSRAGNFTLNVEGNIVTHDGAQVMGDGGAINVTGAGVSIGQDGSVRVSGQEVGRLRVVRIEDPDSLERVGSTRFVLKEGFAVPPNVEADLIPGALEMSNVSTISSVIDLITANRAFGMYTKSAQTIDDMNNSAINQVGKRQG
jgi:flagellar basal-body rod protein FlgG